MPSQWSQEDESGRHLLTTSSSPVDVDNFIHHVSSGLTTNLLLEDGSRDTTHWRKPTWRRLLSAITPIRARRNHGLSNASNINGNYLHCDKGKFGRRKWLRRCMVLGLGILITLGIVQLFTLFAAVIASLFPDKIHRILESWGQLGRTGNDLSSWPTDFTRDISPIPCHSHNDYWRPVPLYSAISAGCISVEADVWLFNGFDEDLYVGHSTASLTRNRTLKNLYIDPLVEILEKQNPVTDFQRNNSAPLHGVFDADPSQSLTLLIDFKTSGPALWPQVLTQLEPLRSRNYLTYFNGTALIPGPITVVGTGNTPFDLLVSNTTYRDVFFDAPLDEMWEDRDCQQAHENHPEDPADIAKTVAGDGPMKLPRSDRGQGKAGKSKPMRPDIYTTDNSYYASVSFGQAIGRMWRNRLSSRQMGLIRGQIRGAHRRGLRVRYWDLPNWPIGWRDHVWDVLVREGVDVLNVDDLEGATKGDWGRRSRKWW